ncbi:MAG: stage II sporulation protein P [Clostridium butyricum]|nr:stage II sporulation protein P [Clostridium butyricum]
MIYIKKPNGSLKRSRAKPNVNVGILVFIFLISILFFRFAIVLKNSKERGAFFYVQLLNVSMPVIENQIYDEANYSENKLSVENVFLQVMGLDNITYKGIIKGELPLVAYVNVGIPEKKYSEESGKLSFNPFIVSEDSISKTAPVTWESDSKNTQIYNPALKKTLDKSKPEVLIYHTHTNENYDGNTPDSYNEQTNVVGAGDVLERELQDNYGISVIHDKTDHCRSYNDSYKRSNETVCNYLKKYGDFKMIIDFHRDSVDDKSATTTEIYGMNAAKIMFVNAKNSTRYLKNKELTDKVYNKTLELFPGLVRKITTYNRGKNAFNQSLSDGCILFEVGSHTNTPEEAKVTAQCMARVIAEIINGKN